MRRIIAFGLVIVSLCIFPRFAFAAGTEQVVSDGGDKCMVVAYNRFNAALLMLGVSPGDTRLDATARAKLSNASTGGRFYEFVQSIEQYDGLEPDDVFGSIGFGVLRLPWVAYCLAYDMHIYTYVGTRDGALEDLQTVLEGGDLGGGSGGGGGDVPSTLVFPLSSYVGTTNYFGNQNTPLLASFTVALQSSAVTSYNGKLNNYTNAYALCWRNEGMAVGRSMTLSVIFCNGAAVRNGNTITFPSGIENQADLTPAIYVNGQNDLSQTRFRNSYYSTTTFNVDKSVYMIDLLAVNAPVVPPTNWPDNPVVTTPEPPEVPTDTPIYPPQVTGPDVTVPQTPDLSDVLDALNEHCEHLQDAIYNGFNDYYETITSYYSDVVDWLQEWLEYFDRVFDDAFADIKLYQRTGNYWLNQIYNKLDDINKKLDGLDDKLQSDDIPNSYDNSNVATDGSSVLVSAYNSLRNKFPFSLLDSLANFATRLKHQAVAPDFDLPVGNPFGNHDPFTVEIDLNPYSDWAAVVRTGELLAVYVALARRAAAMWTREGEGA